MKKTTLYCDCCHKEIQPVTDGSYPRAKISLSQATLHIEFHEVCQTCFDALVLAISKVVTDANLAGLPPDQT